MARLSVWRQGLGLGVPPVVLEVVAVAENGDASLDDLARGVDADLDRPSRGIAAVDPVGGQPLLRIALEWGDEDLRPIRSRALGLGRMR